jgi:hypothetical protein
MLATLATLFAIMWLVALVTVKTASLFIHLLLALAVISFIAHLMRPVSPIDQGPIPPAI